MNDNVLQDWLSDLSWKEQTVLISGIRGPDSAFCPRLKKVSRWMRSHTLQNADPNHTYMEVEDFPMPSELEDEFEFCTVHFATHFVYALEILGYLHPDKHVRTRAESLYCFFVTCVMHFQPETCDQMRRRLVDRKTV